MTEDEQIKADFEAENDELKMVDRERIHQRSEPLNEIYHSFNP